MSLPERKPVMNEQRKNNRDDVSTTVPVDALFNMIRELSSQLSKDLEPLNAIVDSLPRDEQGNPSPFIHRVQHEEQSKAYKTKAKMLDGLKSETGRVFLIIVVVIVANIITSPLAVAVAKIIEKSL